MSITLRVLIVEDEPSDVDLIVYELRRSGFDPDWQRVEAESDYLAHLNADLDVILAAYSLPLFSAVRALTLMQQQGLDIPFIVVTDTASEDIVVECIKQGAADYLIKDRMTRLGQAVVNTLEEKRLRDEKRQAEYWLRMITAAMEQSSEGIAVVDVQGHVLFSNHAFAALHGYESGEIIGKHLSIVHTVDQMTAVRAALHEVQTTGEFSGGVGHVRRDGTTFPSHIHMSLVRDESGAAVGIITTLRDVSDRKRAEDALREERDRAQRYLDVAGVMLVVIGTDQAVRLINRKGCEILGYDEDEIVGRPWFDTFLPEHLGEPTRQLFLDVIRGEASAPEYDETPVVTKSGEQRVIAWHNALILDENGAVAAILSSGEDITERRRTEEALRESEKRYRELFEGIDDVILVHDLEANLLDVNEAACRRLGYSRSELLRMKTTDIDAPDYGAKFDERLERQLAEGGLSQISGAHITRDGRWIDIDVNTKVINYQGQPAVLAVIRDITAHKEVEASLRESEERYRHLIEDAPIPIVVHSEGKVIFANPEAGKVMGADSADDLLGRSVMDVVHPDDREVVTERIRRVYEKEENASLHGERFIRLDGTVIDVEVMASIIDYHGKPASQVIFRDITERKRAEEAEREQRVLAEALRDTAAILTSTLELDVVMNRILENVSSIVPHDAANIMSIEGEYVRVVGQRGYAERGLEDWITNLHYRFDAMPKMRQMADTGQPIVVQDTKSCPDWVETPELDWVQSYASSPIRLEGQLTGFINLYSTQPCFFSQTHAKRLQAFADQAAIAIRNAQLFSAEREQRTLAEALRDTAATLNSSLALDQVLEAILENVGRVVPHAAANIMLVEGETARIVGSRGYSARYIDVWMQQQRWSIDEVPNLRRMAHSGQPLIVADAHTHADWVRQLETGWIRGYAGAPICFGDQLIGFLNLDSDKPDFFTQAHADRLQAFVDQASVAIRNAQLYDTIQQHAAELEAHVAERTVKLQESEARYRAIVQDQTELICRFFPDGTLSFVNRAYCRYFDKAPNELVGQDFKIFVPREDCLLVEQQLAGLSPENPVKTVEHRVKVPGEGLRWLQWTNRLIMDDQGNYVELQAVGRDVTERRRAEEVLRKALTREMELGELKSRFVSMVSHEFRTPLSIILMNVDIIRKYGDRLNYAEKEKYMENVHASIRRMTDLLDDVLTISRAEMGKLEFRPTPVNIGTFCQAVVDEIRTAVGADLTFEYEITGVCRRAVADKRLLRLILSNLVSNAAKYSRPGGTVWITLTCTENQLVLRVEDEGIGIPEPDQPRMFETFFRASNAGGTPGTGLGLTIAKQCVEYHHGTITFESQENKGTTFTVTLPRISTVTKNEDDGR